MKVKYTVQGFLRQITVNYFTTMVFVMPSDRYNYINIVRRFGVGIFLCLNKICPENKNEMMIV
jgi:hypothetical protein